MRNSIAIPEIVFVDDWRAALDEQIAREKATPGSVIESTPSGGACPWSRSVRITASKARRERRACSICLRG